MEVREPSIQNHVLFAIHDQACAVCHTRKAVLYMNTDVFEPCWECQRDGWSTTRKTRHWWNRTR